MRVKKLSRLYLKLPAPQSFITRLIDDLGERRSFIVLLPNGICPDDLWQTMWDDLCRRDFSFAEVSLPESKHSQSPASVLAEKMGVQWSSNTSHTVLNLTETGGLPNIIRLGGFEEMSLDSRKLWVDFILQWAQNSKAIMDRGGAPSSLCLLCPAWALDKLLPESSLYLSVRNWWGMPSVLEMKLVCRLAGGSAENGLESEWRENILPSIAGNDLELSQSIWDDIFDGAENLINSLIKYAKQQRHWSTENLKGWEAESFQSNWGMNRKNEKLDHQQMQWWRKGVLSYT